MKMKFITATTYPSDDELAIAKEQSEGGSHALIKVGNTLYSGVSKWDGEDPFSRYVGCRVAELKAINKYWKDCKKNRQTQLMGVKRLYSMLESTKGIESTDLAMRKARKMIYILESEIEFYDNNIKKNIEIIKKMPAVRAKLLKKINNVSAFNKSQCFQLKTTKD